jgi:hypothetical protein
MENVGKYLQSFVYILQYIKRYFKIKNSFPEDGEGGMLRNGGTFLQKNAQPDTRETSKPLKSLEISREFPHGNIKLEFVG